MIKRLLDIKRRIYHKMATLYLYIHISYLLCECVIILPPLSTLSHYDPLSLYHLSVILNFVVSLSQGKLHALCLLWRRRESIEPKARPKKVELTKQ